MSASGRFHCGARRAQERRLFDGNEKQGWEAQEVAVRDALEATFFEAWERIVDSTGGRQ